MDSSPAKSTFNDGLNNRNEKVFEQIYFALIHYYADILSDSRKAGVRFEKFYAFDSTTKRIKSRNKIPEAVQTRLFDKGGQVLKK